VSTIATRSVSPEVRAELDLVTSGASSPDPAEVRRGEGALAEGLYLLEHGDARGAVKHFRRFVRLNPADTEGRRALGLCLLELDLAAQAVPHLLAVCRAEREEALHHWNLAAAAQKAGRIGRCYLALKDYLGAVDETEGAGERAIEAMGYVAEYEEAAATDHPGTDPTRLAQGEELFLTAFGALTKGQARKAVRGFEKVLRLVPEHYPSWGNLGAAYAEAGFRDEAAQCLRRALELRPDYEPARVSLEQLEGQSER
jgi:tetratricopeptide (TPR) repeat protein